MTRHPHRQLAPNAPARIGAARRAFTLTELLVVIGIIVLVLAFSVPMFNIMSGERSVEGGQNVISAMLQRARARAISVQDKRGMFFFEDPATGQYTLAVVKLVNVGATPSVVEIDTDVDDVQTMPKGVGVAGVNLPMSTRYQPYGLVIFDGMGRTEVVKYVMRKDAKELELTRRFDLPGAVEHTSVIAMGLYDRAALPSPVAPVDDPNRPVITAYDDGQLKWLDENMLIVVMNRYNGTLIRGE
jgi:prepilin-type N-terminal cleavage/methylation domain-containing protein